MSTDASACALLRALIKAACGVATSFTMTPNAPWRTVDTPLLTDKRTKNGGTNAKEGRGWKKKKNKADGRWRPMRDTYKQREYCAQRERVRVEVICDDRMTNGKQRGRRVEREKEEEEEICNMIDKTKKQHKMKGVTQSDRETLHHRKKR